jgi:hypothetical protein
VIKYKVHVYVGEVVHGVPKVKRAVAGPVIRESTVSWPRATG